MLKNCECDARQVDEKVNDYIYEKCQNCGGIIERKAHICRDFKDDGYCKKAERNHYTYPCTINGDFTKCKGYDKEIA